MKDRLISADALKKEWFEIDEEEWESKDIRRLIDEQPTAYDIDEKIKQLEAAADNGDYYVDGYVDIDRIKEILKGGAERAR